jgi:hypothetical protein
MKFKKDFLVNELDLPYSAFKIKDEVVDKTRCSIVHELIFAHEDKYYQTYYSVGATEPQEEKPWEYDDEVECQEVKQVERIVKVWEVVD